MSWLVFSTIFSVRILALHLSHRMGLCVSRKRQDSCFASADSGPGDTKVQRTTPATRLQADGTEHVSDAHKASWGSSGDAFASSHVALSAKEEENLTELCDMSTSHVTHFPREYSSNTECVTADQQDGSDMHLKKPDKLIWADEVSDVSSQSNDDDVAKQGDKEDRKPCIREEQAFLESLVDDARLFAGKMNHHEELCAVEHELAVKYVQGIFEKEYMTNKELKQAIQEVENKNKSNKQIFKKRKDAFKKWVRGIAGNVERFHNQLRFGVKGAENRPPLGKALVLTRIEARNSFSECTWHCED